MTKKVLFVATVVKTHINVFHIPYLKMLKEMGYETHVAARNDYENPEECVIPYCDYFHDMPFERSPLKMNNIKTYKMLKNLMLKENFDIIHCHTPMGGVLTRFAYKNIKNKIESRIIYTAHGFHFYKGAPLLNWMVYYPVEKYFSKYTDTLITINKEDYNRAKNKFKKCKDIQYVPGVGIDLDMFKNENRNKQKLIDELKISKGSILLLSVGELIDRKNHQVIIKCLKGLPDNIHYLIVGSGMNKQKLIDLAKKEGVSNRVHLLGFRTDIPFIMKSSDIFVFPSLQEGLPVAVMEAIACGLPCVVSNIRGNSDLIEHFFNGLLVDSNDSLEYKKEIENILSMDINQMKINNIRKSNEFELEHIKELIKKIYIN